MNINLIFCLLLIFLIICTRQLKNNDNEFMNKESTDAIRGLSIIIIILNHYCQVVQDNSYIGRAFMYSGSISVGFFFFISGYANYLSIKRNNQGIEWLKKRIINICSVVLIILFIYYIHSLFRNSDYYNMYSFIISGRWYIKVLLITYVIFYLNFTYMKRYNVILLWIISILYIIIMKKIQYPSFWYNSILCFPLGVLLAKHKKTVIDVLKKLNKLIIIPFFIVFAILEVKAISEYSKYEIAVSISFIALITIYSYYFKIKSKILSVIGIYSLEIYLCHSDIIKILYREYKIPNDYKMFIIVIITTMIMSYCIKLVVDKWIINRRLN